MESQCIEESAIITRHARILHQRNREKMSIHNQVFFFPLVRLNTNRLRQDAMCMNPKSLNIVPINVMNVCRIS